MNFRVLILLVFALGWPVSGLADFAAGWMAYENGDYATALREYLASG